MELEFKEPTLELFTRLKAANNSKNDKKELKTYLLSTLNINGYKYAIENGLLESNQKDLKAMQSKIDEHLQNLEKEKDTENESSILEVERKICEFYAKICDNEKFNNLANDLMAKDPSISLKLDILMCKIRIAIIFERRADLVRYAEDAKFVFTSSSDWDRKNRFKVYLGLFHLIKAEFSEAAEQFSGALSSFDATELISFDALILYTVFTSLLTFNRDELRVKLIENSEIRKCKEMNELPECFFECYYSEILRKLLKFIDYIEKDLFLAPFKDFFCKEMKIKMYSQLLKSYQSLQLSRMASFFNIEISHLEEDLRSFIADGRISCVIDRIDGVVRMKDVKKVDDFNAFFTLGSKVLREIRREID